MPQPQDPGRLRVIQLLTSDAFAGIERHVLQLARELQSLGCDCALVCPPSAVRLRAEAAAHRVVVCPASGNSSIWAAAAVRDITKRRPQVLHLHDGRSAAAASLLTPFVSGVLVRTQHFTRPASVTRHGLLRSASLALHRTLNRNFDGFIAVSDAVARAARDRRECSTAELAVIPPGIDLPPDDLISTARAARANLAEPVVAYVGRLEADRSLDVLIRAIPRVRSQLADCRFVIAGSGTAQEALKRLARQIHVADAISWPGWVEPASVFTTASIYVNPLPAEGFGMAMAEAMASELPVVAVDSGASPEIVADGVSGILVPDGDHDALADAIMRLAGDRHMAVQMGEAGRELAVRLFGAERTASETLTFYKRLLDGSRS